MHEPALFAGGRHQFGVDLKTGKTRLALRGLVFLPHGSPHIRVDDVGALDGRFGIVADLDFRNAGLAGLRNGLGVGGIPVGTGAHKVQGQPLGQAQPGVHDIVAVAHVDDFQVVEAAAAFQDGEHVRHDLAGVVVVGQAVDHRYRGVLGQLEEVVVGEQAGHDHVVVARHHPGDVLDSLTFADRDVIRSQVNGVTAHAKEAGFKRDAGAGRRFGENHGHAVVPERLVVLAPRKARLDLPGQLEGRPDLVGAKIGHMQKIAFHGWMPPASNLGLII